MLRNILQRERGILLDLYEDEYIVTVIRKHWFSFLGMILIISVLLLTFLIGSILIYNNVRGGGTVIQLAAQLCSTPNAITDNLGKGALIIFGSIYLLSVLGFSYIAWLDYYLDVFVLTNKRILRFEQLVLFGQKVSETSFQHVQDVSSQVKGFIYTLLNVGIVYIETAGENENFAFSLIKDPGGVAAEILELQKRMWDNDGSKSDLSSEKIIQKMEEIHQEEMGDKEHVPIDVASSEKAPNETLEIPKKPETLLSKIKGKIPLIKPMINTIIKPKKKAIPDVVADSITIERTYSDGRKITPNGVIWQSDMEITEDITEVLNKMDD